MADFLDKVIVGLNKGASAISEGSKTMVEKAKLTTAIHSAEQDKKKIAELMGNAAYNLHKNGANLPEELLSFCEEIAKKEAEIEGLRESLASLTGTQAPQNAKMCECGHANTPDAVFCAGCGKKFE